MNSMNTHGVLAAAKPCKDCPGSASLMCCRNAGAAGIDTADDGKAWEQAARDVLANPRSIEEIKADVASLRESIRVDGSAGVALPNGAKNG